MLIMPLYIPAIFIISSLACASWFLFSLSSAISKKLLLIVSVAVILWLVLQSNLSLNGFYLNFNAVPARFLALVLAPLIAMVLSLVLAGRQLAQKLSLKKLTAIHLVRIPVEITLWWLFHKQYVPKLMTFEAGNIDILAGFSAAIILLVAFNDNVIKQKLLIVWNIAGLLLLFNIIIRALLSIPGPLQRLAFEQPNLAINYFPFVFLPSVIVPIVLFSHIISLRKLLKSF